MSDLYFETKPGEEPQASRYGYIVERDGTLLSLRELQVHGEIAYQRNESVREYFDALPDEDKTESKSRADIFAVEDLGHVRISIAPYSYQWNMSWSREVLPTREQLSMLDLIIDLCWGVDEPIGHSVSLDECWPQIRRRMKKPNWGVSDDA